MQVHTILISGKQGSGKTTLSTELQRRLLDEKGWRVVSLSFADTIYEIHDYARGKLSQYGLVPPPKVAVKDGPLLQMLGTEWGRGTYGNDVWVDVLQGRMHEIQQRLNGAFEHLVFLVADCRFRNEFEAFPDALRIRLNCDRDTRQSRCSMWRDNDTHASETDLDNESRWSRVYDTAAHDVDAISTDLISEIKRSKNV